MITAVLSRQYGVPSINLELFQIEKEIIKLISQEVALKYSVLPISKVGATLTLAMADPTNVFAMDDIKFMTGLNVEPVIASEASIQHRHRQILQRLERDRYFSTPRLQSTFEKIGANSRSSGNGNGKKRQRQRRQDRQRKTVGIGSKCFARSF